MPNAPATPGDPFALRIAPQACLARAAFAAARPILSYLLALDRYREHYAAVTAAASSTPLASRRTFESRALNALGLRYCVSMTEGAEIPLSGSLIVVANHPTGATDGLVLLEAVRQVRSDVRVLTNRVLSRIPELRESCFFIDPFGGRSARIKNQSELRAAHLWLRQGRALIVFPSGEVAWRRSSNVTTPVDSPWHSTAGRLALATNARVVPVFLDGRNSWLFYAAGAIHPRLRTMLLARELLKRRGTITRVFMGAPIGSARIREAKIPSAVTAILRARVDALARVPAETGKAPVAPALDPSRLELDVKGLPGHATLLTSGVYDVFCADAVSIPHVLHEIGRLREITFRGVGEGTGRAIDLDRFDDHYQHLFVWNRRSREVAGAYRVGATDRIRRSHGLCGLYTTTLFRYDERLMGHLSPALELGRSFVRREYQRSSSVLLLLWKGIGTLVTRAPRYRRLFGPVSISSRYQDTSQQILRAFLAEHHRESALATLVEPVNPPPPLSTPHRDARGIATVGELDALLERLERGPGIPVLLRQYLRLNATLLGFNVDPAFGDALDALMMVDLTRLPAAMLRRYLGACQADAFLAYHHRSRDWSDGNVAA